MKKYNILDDELKGATLLEASAGTGKTYSLAMLALRLIIVKGFSVKEILLVTFTNAATTEMKDRLRGYIITANSMLKGNVKTKEEATISGILKEVSKKDASERLTKAKNELDSLQVFTIHSFLYQTIQEFAFETGMRFKYELIQDQSELINFSIKEYWRQEIMPLKKEALMHIINSRQQPELSSNNPPFSFDLLNSIVKKMLTDKRLPDSYYSKKELDLTKVEGIIKQIDKDFSTAFDAIQFDATQLKDLKPNEYYGFNEKLAKKAEKIFENPFNYFSRILDRKDKAQFIRDAQEVYNEADIQRITKHLNDFNKERGQIFFSHPFGQAFVINSIAYQCYLFVKMELKKLKDEDNIKHTDELVNDFYKLTLSEEGLSPIKNALTKRFKAFFIDEFQDTDTKQSAIFTCLFSKDTLQYYVGDPKQSIYSFRGADIDSYVRFKTNFNGLKTQSLTTNYRSTKGFVKSCNSYFKRSDNFFNKKGIQYVNVNSNKSQEEGNINIIPSNQSTQDVQRLVLYLLKKGENHLSNTTSKILPENIAILTRSGKTARAIKQALAEIEVPAVVLDDKNVFDTEEAKNMLFFAELLISKKIKDFKRLLLSSWFNSSTIEIKNLDISLADEWLHEVYLVFENKGFYNAFQTFYSLFQIGQRIDKHAFPERVKTNTNQLVEICHKWILQEKISIYNLTKKIYAAFTSTEKIEDYEEQVESDLPSVKIMTIHKSKGLEFDIVICPDLPFEKKMSSKHSTFDFKLNSEGYFIANYLAKQEGGVIKKAYNQTQVEENRRLEYVVLTRAKQDFYGFVKESKAEQFQEFVNSELKKELTSYNPLTDKYEPESQKKTIKRPTLEHHKIDKKVAFGVSSFSNLSVAQHHYYETQLIDEIGYDQFIFNQLKKGADAGNLIHELFELHNFDSSNTQESISIVKNKYPSYLINDENIPFFEDFMQHVLKANIPGMDEFTLSSLNNSKRICEMAFHWKVESFKKSEIETLLKDDEVKVKYDFDGYIKGFIDFIFEHRGKYYILDWKSNHIGSSVEDYTQEKMNVAMKGSNYHLQHYIYKKAFLAYLQSINPNKSSQEINDMWGGIIYCFVRGCRENKELGMFRYPE